MPLAIQKRPGDNFQVIYEAYAPGLEFVCDDHLDNRSRCESRDVREMLNLWRELAKLAADGAFDDEEKSSPLV